MSIFCNVATQTSKENNASIISGDKLYLSGFIQVGMGPKEMQKLAHLRLYRFVSAQLWWRGTNLQREEDKRAARGSAAFALTCFSFLCQTDEAGMKNLQRCSQNTVFNLYSKIFCAFEHSINNALFWNAASMSKRKKANFYSVSEEIWNMR